MARPTRRGSSLGSDEVKEVVYVLQFEGILLGGK